MSALRASWCLKAAQKAARGSPGSAFSVWRLRAQIGRRSTEGEPEVSGSLKSPFGCSKGHLRAPNNPPKGRESARGVLNMLSIAGMTLWDVQGSWNPQEAVAVVWL